MVKLKILEVAKEKGIEEGMEAQKIATARALLEMNMPLETIVKATNLDLSEIEKLRESA